VGLADLALSIGQGDSEQTKVANIIEFVESDWGLGVRLYPVQRIILKAYYGVPLDDTTKNVPIPVGQMPWLKEDLAFMTEAEYLRYLHENGRCNLAEITEDQELREMVLGVGRRSGKCILGDSLVLTDQGIRRIEDLAPCEGEGSSPLNVGIVQEEGVRARSDFFYNGGVRDVRVLTTRCGYQLGGTNNHRIKVMAKQGMVDWKYLSDIEPGDVVCIHRNTNLWASEPVDCTPFHNTLGRKELEFPDQLDEDWGRLLGYLVGDGLWNYRSRVEVTVEHSETWDTLKALFAKLLGSYSVSIDKRRKNTGALKFASVGMRQFLHDLGFRLGTDRDAKMVPWSILQSPRPVVQAFLRGLFEADGGVESGGQTVSFSTASRRLAHEVQTLLLNLGIVSRVRPKTVKGRVYWGLVVRGRRSRLTFAERVGFDSRKKMDPLLASFDSGREGGDTESIPYQRGWCQRLLESVPKVAPLAGRRQAWSRSKLRDVLGNTIKPSTTDEMTYPRLDRVLPVAEELGGDPEVIQHFRRLEALDYFFDPVEDVAEDRELVYDLSVPDGHEFVANGMTNHNTFVSACIVAYEIYKLLLKGNPQEYYGLGRTSEIGIVSVATGKDQAALLYGEASGHFAQCAFFHPYTANNTQTYAKFQTPTDIERFGRYKDDPTAKATLRVTFNSCIAKGLRGPGNMLIIFDELAHFNTVGQSDAETVYDAITPSTATFSPFDPETGESDGDSEGRIISISSPLGKQGFFYENFMKGFSGGLEASDMLCIQAPTWEVNPRVKPAYFAKKYAKKPSTFFTEFGAEFTSRRRGWIEREEDLLACVDPLLVPKIQAPARAPHFMGVDVGLKGNGTAVAIGHIEDNKIITDLVEQIKAGEGKYEGADRLDFDEVAEWVYQFTRRFFIVGGMFDQWAGIPFEQSLVKKGLKQLKAEHMTKNLNSQIFQNAKNMIWDQRVILFDYPIEDGKAHSDFIQELLDLQATYQSKYVTIVEAPQVEGKFDDRADAWVRMVWLASQALGKGAYIAKGQRIAKVTAAQSGHRRAFVKSRRMGSSPDRRRSPSRRGRVMGVR